MARARYPLLERTGYAQVIHGMKYGGERYKFDEGVSIDHVHDKGRFIVWQAGSPESFRIGETTSLKEAKDLAELFLWTQPGLTEEERAARAGKK